ncbi:uncharacterized protein LOC142380565 [Odontesthes bonariensis]|uniref:uncharacterized protein LOC142380565 n=1 Tax=Odontesthes bonariensis TaxID=219752 RepID=UPI003F58D0A0
MLLAIYISEERNESTQKKVRKQSGGAERCSPHKNQTVHLAIIIINIITKAEERRSPHLCGWSPTEAVRARPVAPHPERGEHRCWWSGGGVEGEGGREGGREGTCNHPNNRFFSSSSSSFFLRISPPLDLCGKSAACRQAVFHCGYREGRPGSEEDSGRGKMEIGCPVGEELACQLHIIPEVHFGGCRRRKICRLPIESSRLSTQ